MLTVESSHFSDGSRWVGNTQQLQLIHFYSAGYGQVSFNALLGDGLANYITRFLTNRERNPDFIHLFQTNY